MLEQPEKLSDADRMLLQSPSQAKAQAEAVHEFVTRHIGVIYRLEDGSQVDLPSGRITRPEQAVPDLQHRSQI